MHFCAFLGQSAEIANILLALYVLNSLFQTPTTSSTPSSSSDATATPITPRSISDATATPSTPRSISDATATPSMPSLRSNAPTTHYKSTSSNVAPNRHTASNVDVSDLYHFQEQQTIESNSISQSTVVDLTTGVNSYE